MRHDMSKLKISAQEQSSKANKGNNRFSEPGTSGVHDKQQQVMGPKFEIREVGGLEIREEDFLRIIKLNGSKNT
ncbi:hypothetical protein DH2020_008830 [Rehmannia glutinosa]|uniref:Uncharacterized protein n=1 Tax=Rehmannia glutinosa TaxID=99300 RepID=A0ABR0X4I8_REHGL